MLSAQIVKGPSWLLSPLQERLVVLLLLLWRLLTQNIMSHMAQLRRLMGVSDDLHKVRCLLQTWGVPAHSCHNIQPLASNA